MSEVANGTFSLETLKDKGGATLVLQTPGGFRDCSWRVTSDSKFSLLKFQNAINGAIDEGARMSVIYEDAEDVQEEEEGGQDEPGQESSSPMMVSISTPEKRTQADTSDKSRVPTMDAGQDRVFPLAKRESRAADGCIQGWLEVRQESWFWSRRWVVIDDTTLEYWFPNQESRAGYFDFAQVHLPVFRQVQHLIVLFQGQYIF